MEELPSSKKSVWEQFNDEQRAVAVEGIARLMVKVVSDKNNQEPKNDR
jgi:hypothetical protein